MVVALLAVVVVAVAGTGAAFFVAATRLLPVRLDNAFLMPAVRDLGAATTAPVVAFFAVAVVGAVARLTIVVPLLTSLPVLGRSSDEWAVVAAGRLTCLEPGRVCFDVAVVMARAVGLGIVDSLIGDADFRGDAMNVREL